MLKNTCLSLLLIFLVHCFTVAQNPVADSLLQLLKKSGEDTSRARLFVNLSANFKFTEPEKAIKYGNMGIALSKKLNFDKAAVICYMNVSVAYTYSYIFDTALLYLDTAFLYAHKLGDLKRLGLAYLNRADIYRQMQNFNQTLIDCETALKYADQANDDDVRARVNQTIGAVYYRQELHPQSIGYFNKAIELYRKTGNMRMSAAVLNNLGLSYKSMKEYTKAITVMEQAIHITDSLKEFPNLSIFNGNLSDVYFALERYKDAEKYANKAMQGAVQLNNETLKALAWVFLGNAYYKQKRFGESLNALDSAMQVYKQEEDYDRINSTADGLAEVYAASGNYTKAYEYMKISQAANDTVVKQRYDEDIASMQTKFKVNEKDKEILLLAKDKELQQQKLKEQRFLLAGSVLLIALVLAGIALFINRNRLRQRMKELELRNQIAADLHDEVGSSLSSIHMLTEMAGQQVNESTQKDILARMSTNAKETMDKMSDIVWMIKPGETEAGSLKQKIEGFAYEICSSKNIEIEMEIGELEKCKLNMEQRKNIYLIFKEALNNAVKYSGTEKIKVTASIQNKELQLQVKDFGKGFDNKIIKKGNGLENMQNRAKELGGKIAIDSAPAKGTTISLGVGI